MNIKGKLALMLLVVFFSVAALLTAPAPSAAAAASSSGKDSGKVTLSVDKTLYPLGQGVTITLYNGTQKSITVPSAAPWTIENADGKTVYRPAAIQKLSTVLSGEARTWTWTQKAQNGKQVAAGFYSVSVKTSAGEFTCEFAISGLKNDVDVDNPDPVFERLPNPFKDVTGSVAWGDAHILRMAQLGIVKGKTADTFEPDAHLTRAEFVTLLLRAAGLAPKDDETPKSGISFEDVPQDHWAYKFVARASELGIITRAEYRRKFEPDGAITRMEIAIMLTRALGLDTEAMDDAGSNLPFDDAKDVPPLYRGYVLRAVEWKVLKGYDDNTFRPNRRATRREACVMLYRVLLNP